MHLSLLQYEPEVAREEMVRQSQPAPLSTVHVPVPAEHLDLQEPAATGGHKQLQKVNLESAQANTALAHGNNNVAFVALRSGFAPFSPLHPLAPPPVKEMSHAFHNQVCKHPACSVGRAGRPKVLTEWPRFEWQVHTHPPRGSPSPPVKKVRFLFCFEKQRRLHTGTWEALLVRLYCKAV